MSSTQTFPGDIILGPLGRLILSANNKDGVLVANNQGVISNSTAIAVQDDNDPVIKPEIAPANGGSTFARLLFGTASGFGIYFGSGEPTVTAGRGSIYLRTDGVDEKTRAYVNTDGATTWTFLMAGA